MAAVQVVNANLSLNLQSATRLRSSLECDKDDTLIGNSLENRLKGGLGNDLLVGGAGDDTYLFDTDLALGNDT